MVLRALISPALVQWSFLLCGSPGFVLLWQAAKLIDRLWWHPRRLERALRAQGLRGTSYRFLVSDVIDYERRSKEERSRSMSLRCHNIAPLVAPLLHDIIREHGKACISWFGPYPKVTISDPEQTKEVMSNKFGHFEKLKFPALSRLLAGGVATYEGEQWVKHRRILNPAFHPEKIKLMMPAFSTCCQELVSRWTQSLGSDGTYEVDVCPEFQRLTGDVISRTAFGSNYAEGARIFQLQSEQTARLLARVKKIIIPGYLTRMQAMQEGENTKNDLLGLMLESNMRGTDENGQCISGMTIDEVVEECKLFYFAGTETTSILLTWTMVILSMHPEWQDRAREEVLGLFGKNKIDYEDFGRLKTVTMILYEVLRLYPPVVAFIRKTYKEMEIGGITFPAGVLIELPVLLMHHDPDIWGSDVHEFKPERFADGISKASNNSCAFLPFGWGQRICIGQQFAVIEPKFSLCMIFQCFEFELAPSYTHALDNTKMLRPMLGAQIKLRAI
ncbi:cytochrome P450 72A13-like [Triticum dicoccoides]|nr:cytochrome P450 72A13-like [Triticum dicoccoides]